MSVGIEEIYLTDAPEEVTDEDIAEIRKRLVRDGKLFPRRFLGRSNLDCVLLLWAYDQQVERADMLFEETARLRRYIKSAEAEIATLRGSSD